MLKFLGCVMEVKKLFLLFLCACSYAPWCPACLDLKPQWAELAQKELKDGLKIAQIDVNKYAGRLLFLFAIM